MRDCHDRATELLDVKEFLAYWEEAKQNSANTVKCCRGQLRHLLEWADDRLLARASAIRPTFPVYLKDTGNDGGDRPMSTGTLAAICNVLRGWLQYPGPETGDWEIDGQVIENLLHQLREQQVILVLAAADQRSATRLSPLIGCTRDRKPATGRRNHPPTTRRPRRQLWEIKLSATGEMRKPATTCR